MNSRAWESVVEREKGLVLQGERVLNCEGDGCD